MKKLGVLLMLMLALAIGSHRASAQSVTITLMPGWTWISCPTTDTLDFATAFGSFTPMQGDIIKSQWGQARYTSGLWLGRISQFYPGYGYMYKSNRQAPIMVTFNAQQPAPQIIVTTAEPTDITHTSAVVGSTVTLDEGNHFYVRGVCWSTEQMPTVDDNHLSDGSGTGASTIILTGLSPITTYYVRAYAVTDYGLAYGEEQSFTTLDNSCNGEAPEGAINGKFTINEDGDQVYFSQGNLQYQASTNTWRFAENQWNFVGTQIPNNSNLGSLGGNVDGSDNRNVSPTYDGWIDLFGWGTSGWDNGNVYYQPYDYECLTDWNAGDFGRGYGPTDGTNYTYDLTGIYANADWGVYNAISNGGNVPGLWRTLTSDEWNWIINYRDTPSGIRYAKAVLNGVNGAILLPDSWNTSVYALNYTNRSDAPYTTNEITDENWVILEANGAVFLPAAGGRLSGGGVAFQGIGSSGWYWSVTHQNSDYVYSLWVGSDYLELNHTYYYSYRHLGRSVRLVYNVE